MPNSPAERIEGRWTRVEVERAAERLAQEHGFEPQIPVEQLAGRCGARVVQRELEDSTSGLLIRGDDEAVIVVNARHHPYRQRFTVAHELGHLFLHRDSAAVFVDGMKYDFRMGSSQAGDPREREANAFAAALLMPEASLRQDAGVPVDPFDDEKIQGLVRRYGVSSQALVIRLEQLGLLDGHS